MPKIAHPLDTSNFDENCEEEAHGRFNFEDDYASDNQFHGFFEFTFRRFFDDNYHLEDLRREAMEKESKEKEAAGGGGGSGSGAARGGPGPVYV